MPRDTRVTVSGLGERLVAGGVLTEDQLRLALREQERKGAPLGRVITDLGLVTAGALSKFLAGEAHSRLVDINRLVIDSSTLTLVPSDLSRRLLALPISRVNGTLTVAMADPLNVLAIDSIRQVTGLEIEVVTAPESDILGFLDRKQADGEAIQESIDRLIQEEVSERERSGQETGVVVEGEVPDADDAPIIQIVNQIITRAVQDGASDIHFEPQEKFLRVRTRIDGLLCSDVLVPKALQSAVTARVKILANMDVAETRLPQDGRAAIFVGQRRINLRVSTLPSCYGENIVARILDSSSQVLSLAKLGLSAGVEGKLRGLMDAPHGVIIVTGPTGSGKTTTLYAILNALNTVDLSIFTLEDPIEYRLAGLCQTQIKEEIGLTFNAGLRCLLRQDPDVILVGETRDTETATLMVRAALTGHLVFTTLHTNDAVGAVPRLLDMGIEPYLLPGSLLGVLAQRLVRRLCANCKTPVPDPEAVFKRLNVKLPKDREPTLWKGQGCEQCKGTGFKGRQAVFELLTMDERFHEPIVRRASTSEYFFLARQGGMETMFEDGLRRALEGVTTIDELLRVASPSGE